MKVKKQLLVLVVIPTLFLGTSCYATSSMLMKREIENQAYNGMAATGISIREVWDSTLDGDYSLDENGNMWKGDNNNLSENIKLLDSVKYNTGYDMTIFYNDTRIMTTITDEKGVRQVGTKASDKVIEEVVKNGKEFMSNNIDVLGERYICYYVPIFHRNSKQVAGMIFLGMPYKNITNKITENGGLTGGIILVDEVIAIICCLILSGGLVKSLNKSISYLEDMSSGKIGLSMDEKLLKRKDEIGNTCRAVGVLDDRLREIITRIQNQAVEVESTANNCNQRSAQVQEVAQQVDVAVAEITNSATEQASEANEAKDSVAVIGNVIKQTDGELKDFLSITKEMDDASDNAKKMLKQLNDYMVDVENAVGDIREQTNETHSSVEKISQMTEVIAEIASETNLLSLNASIEAARAGEAGRGFAVVASEIQKLADQSNTSAGEIQEILTQLRHNSETSVESMQSMSNIISEQNKKLDQTNAAFDTVVDGIAKSIEGIDRIVKGMQTLDNAREQTLTVVDNVSNFAQQNAAATQETVASMDEVTTAITEVADRMGELLNLAKQMQETAAVFTVQK